MSPLKSGDTDKPSISWYLYAIKFLCGYQQETRDNAEVVPLTAAPTLRPGIYATDVNILNPNYKQNVQIYKFYVPLIDSGKPIGREPEKGKQLEVWDEIVLGPHQATFDDCFKMYRLNGLPITSGPLSMGYFEIFCEYKLIVNAVYTVNDVRGLSTCLEILTITPMEINWKPPGPKNK